MKNVSQDSLSFDLIEGTFSTDDAVDILRTLIRAKIRHHECRLFSDNERKGHDSLNTEQRVIALKKSLNKLEKFAVDSASNKHKRLHIHSTVLIETVEEAAK